MLLDLALLPQKSLGHFWHLDWVTFSVFSIFDGSTFLGTFCVVVCSPLILHVNLPDGSFPQFMVCSLSASSRLADYFGFLYR